MSLSKLKQSSFTVLQGLHSPRQDAGRSSCSIGVWKVVRDLSAPTSDGTTGFACNGDYSKTPLTLTLRRLDGGITNSATSSAKPTRKEIAMLIAPENLPVNMYVLKHDERLAVVQSAIRGVLAKNEEASMRNASQPSKKVYGSSKETRLDSLGPQTQHRASRVSANPSERTDSHPTRESRVSNLCEASQACHRDSNGSEATDSAISHRKRVALATPGSRDELIARAILCGNFQKPCYKQPAKKKAVAPLLRRSKQQARAQSFCRNAPIMRGAGPHGQTQRASVEEHRGATSQESRKRKAPVECSIHAASVKRRCTDVRLQ